MQSLTRHLNESKRKNRAIQYAGTGMFIKFTQDTDTQRRFVIYSTNPEVITNPKSVRLSIPSKNPKKIEGSDRFVKFAKEQCGTEIYFKEESEPMELNLWDRIIRAVNNCLYSNEKIELLPKAA